MLAFGCGGPESASDGGMDGGSREGSADTACVGVDDGISCGTGMVCMAQRCVSSTAMCGNGSVEPGEACDDGNETAFDGCEPGTCTPTCDADSICDDGIECNGVETCAPCADEACAAGRRCANGTALDNGTPCTRDDGVGMCRASVCAPPQCGDGNVDEGEHCDDGNMVPGDGCELDCRVTCEVDTTLTNTWYLDCDGDGFAGATALTRTQCLPPAPNTSCEGGWTRQGPTSVATTDCDDGHADIRPGIPELCDDVDHNCDGSAMNDCTAIPCTDPSECSSGFCVDGVCCDTECTGQCEACNIDPGTCTQVTGDPVGSRDACDGTGICAGSCGSSRTECDYPTSVCSAQSCTGSTLSHVSMCDGAGTCPDPSTESCAPYACNGTSCRTVCSGDSDCSAGNYCNAGVCLSTKPKGYMCSATTECTSGYCVDGYCCDMACNGQCEACNGASPGTCAPVAGAPVAPRPACTTSAATQCNGTCNGVNRASCTYPTVSCAYCGTAGRLATYQYPYSGGTCSNGTCTGGTTGASCGDYACHMVSGVPQCYTRCTTTAQCYSGGVGGVVACTNNMCGPPVIGP